MQERFNKTNTIYKITRDIDLERETLVIPSGCILDFYGGSVTNGTITLTSTLLLPNGLNAHNYITATISGTYKEGQLIYDPSLKKMIL